MDTMNKRKRSSNWESEERDLLQQLVLEKSEIFENKNVDTITNKKKHEAWKEIHARFNKFNPCDRIRDISQLRVQWRNLKMNNKKFNLSKNEVAKPVGCLEPTSPIQADVVVTLEPHTQFSEEMQQFDSDGCSRENISEPTPDGYQKFLMAKSRRKRIQDQYMKKSFLNKCQAVRDLEMKMLKDEHDKRMEEIKVRIELLNEEKLMRLDEYRRKEMKDQLEISILQKKQEIATLQVDSLKKDKLADGISIF